MTDSSAFETNPGTGPVEPGQGSGGPGRAGLIGALFGAGALVGVVALGSTMVSASPLDQTDSGPLSILPNTEVNERTERVEATEGSGAAEGLEEVDEVQMVYVDDADSRGVIGRDLAGRYDTELDDLNEFEDIEVDLGPEFDAYFTCVDSAIADHLGVDDVDAYEAELIEARLSEAEWEALEDQWDATEDQLDAEVVACEASLPEGVTIDDLEYMEDMFDDEDIESCQDFDDDDD